MLKLGYKASAEQFGPKALLDFSVEAERDGFDSVFISDHFQPWKHTDGHAPSVFPWMGALGASTQRIVMGTSVLTPTFRYHPSVVAQVFGTLGVMFPGRVILGVGTGEGLNEVPSTGMKWPETKERFARLREALTLIRRLWTEDRLSFADGEDGLARLPRATTAQEPRRVDRVRLPQVRGFFKVNALPAPGNGGIRSSHAVRGSVPSRQKMPETATPGARPIIGDTVQLADDRVREDV